MSLRENGKKLAVYAAQTLVQLLDTNIINKANGDILQYDSTTQKWKNQPTTFTEASSRANIDSGDSISTIFGKIKKFFTDLKTVAFSGSYNDLSDKPTIPTVPTNVSAFNNDSGYLTNSTLPNSIQNLTIASFSGAGSSDAYCLLCEIKINSTYINGASEITLSERGRIECSRISWRFQSVNNTDPGVDSFTVFGSHNDIWIYKSATSTWNIYVRKNENWSAIFVKDCYLYGGFTLTWKMTNASLPSGATQADWAGHVKYAYTAESASFATSAGNVNGYYVLSTVPSNAKFSDTVTSFQVKEFTFSVSLAAGEAKAYMPSITQSGWTPIAIAGLYTGNIVIAPIRWGIVNNNTASVDLRNYYSSAASGTASITVLYYKNT